MNGVMFIWLVSLFMPGRRSWLKSETVQGVGPPISIATVVEMRICI